MTYMGAPQRYRQSFLSTFLNELSTTGQSDYEAFRQADREAGWQGGREGGRQGQREAGGQTGRQTGRQGGRQADGRTVPVGILKEDVAYMADLRPETLQPRDVRSEVCSMCNFLLNYCYFNVIIGVIRDLEALGFIFEFSPQQEN